MTKKKAINIELKFTWGSRMKLEFSYCIVLPSVQYDKVNHALAPVIGDDPDVQIQCINDEKVS